MAETPSQIRGPSQDAFLEVAESIARRLCRQAEDDDHGGSLWRIPNLGRGGPVTTGPYLYRGTAGIALFLMRLSLRCARPEYLQTAQRALQASLRFEAAQDKACGGFYNGTGGLIAALAEMGELVGFDVSDGRNRWLDSARRLGDKLLRGTRFEGGFDLITGDAGSLLGLLHLHHAVASLEKESDGATPYLEGARKLGDRLLASSRREPDGISWDGMHPQVTRNLVGCSHGAGGVGLALLELWRHGHDDEDLRFLVGAVQALRYEDSLPGADEGRWPDLRDDRLMGRLEGRDLEGLRRALREGTLGEPPTPSVKMAVWCHGAPGIALVRAHFLRLTGDAHWAAGLHLAAERTLEVAASQTPESHSLCHGRCGNADILLEVGRQCGVTAWVDAALEVARRGLDEVVAQNVDWNSGYSNSGYSGGDPAPGLLLGDAGIGLFYLRCADPSVPGCLLPTVSTPSPARRAPGEAVQLAVHRAYLDHLPRTVACLEELGVATDELPVTSSADLTDCVGVLLKGLMSDGQSDGPEVRISEDSLDRLRSVFVLESAAFRRLRDHQDFTRPYLDSLRRQMTDLRHPGTVLGLPSTSRLVHLGRDLGDLLDDPAAGLDAVRREASTYLLYERDHRIHLRRLDPLAAALYGLLEQPSSPSDVVRRLADHLQEQGLFDEDAAQRSAVEARLRRTLQHALDSGMVIPTRPSTVPVG